MGYAFQGNNFGGYANFRDYWDASVAKYGWPTGESTYGGYDHANGPHATINADGLRMQKEDSYNDAYREGTYTPNAYISEESQKAAMKGAMDSPLYKAPDTNRSAGMPDYGIPDYSPEHPYANPLLLKVPDAVPVTQLPAGWDDPLAYQQKPTDKLPDGTVRKYPWEDVAQGKGLHATELPDYVSKLINGYTSGSPLSQAISSYQPLPQTGQSQPTSTVAPISSPLGSNDLNMPNTAAGPRLQPYSGWGKPTNNSQPYSGYTSNAPTNASTLAPPGAKVNNSMPLRSQVLPDNLDLQTSLPPSPSPAPPLTGQNQSQIDIPFQAQGVFDPHQTQYAVNQAMASAAPDMRWAQKAHQLEGMSRNAGTQAQSMGDVVGQLGKGLAQSAAIPFADQMANQNSMNQYEQMQGQYGSQISDLLTRMFHQNNQYDLGVANSGLDKIRAMMSYFPFLQQQMSG